MALNPNIGRETFFRALYSDGFLGKDSGLPLTGLGDDSTPDDFIAWALMMNAAFSVSHWFAEPGFVAKLHTRWKQELAAESRARA